MSYLEEQKRLAKDIYLLSRVLVTKIKKVYNVDTRSKPKTSLIHYGDDGGGASDGGDASKEDKSDPSNENLYLFKPGITFYRDFILLFVWTATFS
jgi:hypothetical protein